MSQGRLAPGLPEALCDLPHIRKPLPPWVAEPKGPPVVFPPVQPAQCPLLHHHLPGRVKHVGEAEGRGGVGIKLVEFKEECYMRVASVWQEFHRGIT